MGRKKQHDDIKKERFTWNYQMDNALINSLYQQHVEGNRVNGTFTTTAYENIVKDLRETYHLDVDKERIRNRLKTVKEHFGEAYDLFKNRTSGFAWSPITRMFDADDEVWEKLIEVKPSAKKWKTTPISNYEKLVELYGKDRATGACAETAKEKRLHWANSTNEDELHTIDGIDDMVSQSEVMLEPFGLEDNDDICATIPESQVTNKSENCSKKKRKKSLTDVEKDNEVLREAMGNVAAAIREGNAAYEKSRGLVSVGEIHQALHDIGVESQCRTAAYLFLASKPERMNIFFGCPVEFRKETLDHMMSDPQNRF